MAGNPIYGAGYYKGFGDGQKTGTILGVAGLAAGAVLAAAQWGVGKYKKHRLAKHEAEAEAVADDQTDELEPGGAAEPA